MDTLEVSNYTSFYPKKENRIVAKQIPKQCFILNQNYFHFQTRNLLGLKMDLLLSECRKN